MTLLPKVVVERLRAHRVKGGELANATCERVSVCGGVNARHVARDTKHGPCVGVDLAVAGEVPRQM
jgi:hypothetical protein